MDLLHESATPIVYANHAGNSIDAALLHKSANPRTALSDSVFRELDRTAADPICASD